MQLRRYKKEKNVVIEMGKKSNKKRQDFFFFWKKNRKEKNSSLKAGWEKNPLTCMINDENQVLKGQQSVEA